MGERTVVDTDVRDTWEMDAPLVRFENSSWVVWVMSVVREVYAELGVNWEASRLRCELYKLLVYETGSQYVQISSVLVIDSS
jgi:hypothetical protein